MEVFTIGFTQTTAADCFGKLIENGIQWLISDQIQLSRCSICVGIMLMYCTMRGRVPRLGRLPCGSA